MGLSAMPERSARCFSSRIKRPCAAMASAGSNGSPLPWLAHASGVNWASPLAFACETAFGFHFDSTSSCAASTAPGTPDSRDAAATSGPQPFGTFDSSSAPRGASNDGTSCGSERVDVMSSSNPAHSATTRHVTTMRPRRVRRMGADDDAARRGVMIFSFALVLRVLTSDSRPNPAACPLLPHTLPNDQGGRRTLSM